MNHLGKLLAALLLAGGLSCGAVQASPADLSRTPGQTGDDRPLLVERQRPERPHWDNRYRGDRRRPRPPYQYGTPPPPYPVPPYGYGAPYTPPPFGYDPRRPRPTYPYGYDPRRSAPRYDDDDAYDRWAPFRDGDRRIWKRHRSYRPAPPPPPPPPAWPGFNGWI